MLAERPQPVALGRGLFDPEGRNHRTAWLRPLTGVHEAMVGSAAAASGPSTTTTLLASSVEAIGAYKPVEAAHVAALSRGDRQRLMLALRAQLFGESLSLVVRCPVPSCGEAADVELSIDELAPEPVTPSPEVIHCEVDGQEIVLREPTGHDDEVLTATGRDRAELSARLWARLVLSIGDREGIDPAGWQALAPELRQGIALALAEHGSELDLRFVSRCPVCDGLLEFTVDPFELLRRELAAGTDRLAAEVHSLAFYYHWSEADILALPRTSRWTYIDLVRRQLEGQPLVDPGGRHG